MKSKDVIIKLQNKFSDYTISVSFSHSMMTLSILFITIAVLHSSFLPKISLYHSLETINLLPDSINDTNLENIKQIPIKDTLIIAVGVLSTVIAIVFSLALSFIEGIAEKYTPYIVEDYRKRFQNKTLSLFTIVIVYSFLLIMVGSFFHNFFLLIFFIISVIGFVLCITRLIVYFSSITNIIDPIKFASILEQRTIELIKNTKIKGDTTKYQNSEAENLLATFGDISIKALERNDEAVSRVYADKLYSIYSESILKYGRSIYIEQLFESYSRILDCCIPMRKKLRFEIMGTFIDFPWSLYKTKDVDWFKENFFKEYEYYLTYVFHANRNIIDEGDFELFKSEIDNISLNFFYDPREILDELKSRTISMYQNADSIDHIDTLLFSIDTLKQNFGVYSKYEDILEVVNKLNTRSPSLQINNKTEKEGFNKDCLNLYIDFNFHKIFFLIGAYCLFIDKQQSLEVEKYIHELWYHTNPDDSYAIIANEVPITSDPGILLYMLFWGGMSDLHWFNRYRFDTFHSIRPYIRKYTLLRLTHLIVDQHKKLEITNLDPMKTKELEYTFEFVSHFLHEVDDLIKCCEELIIEHTKWQYLFKNRNLKADQSSEISSDIDIEDVEEMTVKMRFEKTIEWLIETRDDFKNKIERIEEQLPLDNNKILSCKKGIISSFNETEIISKTISFSEISEEDEISENERIKIGYYNIVPKNWFIKSSNVDSFQIWSQYGRGLALTEMKFLIDKINSMDTIERIEFSSSISIVEVFKVISSAVSSLRSKSFSPSTIFLPAKYYRQFREESRNKESKLNGVLPSGMNTLKIDENNLLNTIIPHNMKDFTEIILIDKNVCTWTFEPSLEENNRLHISIFENSDDASKVNFELETIGTLKIKDTSGVIILESHDDSN